MPPPSVQRRMRSFGRSLTRRQSLVGEPDRALQPGESLASFTSGAFGSTSRRNCGSWTSKPSMSLPGMARGPAADRHAAAPSSARRVRRRSCRSGGPCGRPSRCSPGPRRSENSPGPCSIRVPSMLSIHQRPDSTTIHCGAGFSCQSPTQPTGCTVKTTVPRLRACLSFHCGAAPPTCFQLELASARTAAGG